MEIFSEVSRHIVSTMVAFAHTYHLLQMASYMTPEDLLNLSRTSVGLRRILMSKSSKRVWVAARMMQEIIPPCPPDLNEPQYADLLFGKGCSVSERSRLKLDISLLRIQFCSTARVKDVDVLLRSRTCKECFEEV